MVPTFRNVAMARLRPLASSGEKPAASMAIVPEPSGCSFSDNSYLAGPLLLSPSGD